MARVRAQGMASRTQTTQMYRNDITLTVVQIVRNIAVHVDLFFVGIMSVAITKITWLFRCLEIITKINNKNNWTIAQNKFMR